MTSAPEYFDLQVNGYGGVDFNADGLSGEELHKCCKMLCDDGAAGILATIITAQPAQMIARLKALVNLRERDELAKSIIAGIHIEGPFISPEDGYRGAHRRDAICASNVDLTHKLLDAAGGLCKYVTLAPEMDAGGKLTAMLAKQNIAVAAGHTNASVDQLRAGIDNGLALFTHLGNGCPMQMPRHDNIIQRVLSVSDKLTITFIADGAHVPYFALRNYLQSAGIEKSIIVTDATAAAGLGPGTYALANWKFKVGEDLVAWAPDGSHLLGSAMPMSRVRNNLQDHLGLTAAQIDRLTSVNPKSALTRKAS